MDRRRKLINFHEAATRKILRVAAQNNDAEVFAKIRIADVLNIERSGLNDELYRYGLQAHFDFVVSDAEHVPLFAVEFDGHGHQDPRAAAKDLKKNRICQVLEFPLARVRDEHIFRRFRGTDYVTWLTEVYFAFQALLRAQEEGQFPADEPADPLMFMSMPNLPGRFPLWLSATARVRLQELHRQDRIANPVPHCLVGEDAQGTTACLAVLQQNDGTYLAETGSIYLRRFGVSPHEASEEIAVVKLARSVEAGTAGVDQAELRSATIRFLRSHPTALGHGGTVNLGFYVRFRSENGVSEWRIGPIGSGDEVVISVPRTDS